MILWYDFTETALEGFAGQHLVVVPKPVRDEAKRHPLLRSLLVTDAGCFPQAHYENHSASAEPEGYRPEAVWPDKYPFACSCRDSWVAGASARAAFGISGRTPVWRTPSIPDRDDNFPGEPR